MSRNDDLASIMSFLKSNRFLRTFFFFICFIFVDQLLFSDTQESIKEKVEKIRVMQEALGWKGWTTLALFILTLAALVLELKPPDVVMLFSTGFMVVIGILPPQLFLEGFSNEIILTIAMLCIVVRAMEINGILEVVGSKVLSKSKNFYLDMLSLTVPVGVGSAFLNNTPIVLLMTPIVRKWALKNNFSPSKFLLPLSYAAVLGGACTLIGTSTNLVVHGLMRRYEPLSGFTFFELSYVGIPCAIAGLIYLLTIGRYLLPDRTDPSTALSEETREFTVEFKIKEKCPLANTTVRQASRYFPNEMLIQVERNETLIDSPGPEFVLFEGDRLVLAGDIHKIAELHAIQGLQSMADPHFKLDVGSSHFSEVVISSTSTLIGKSIRQIGFRTTFGASVLAVYREGWRVHGDVRDTVLQPGDTLMLLSGEPMINIGMRNRDFYYIHTHEKLLVFNKWKAAIILFSLIGLVVAATMGYSILISSMTAALIVIATKSISIREAKNSIIWNILLLIACSFALGRAIEINGVASYFAQILLSLIGSEPTMLIGGILLVTILSTEFMTNNAAALVLFPIAIEIAHLAGFNSPEVTKTVGVTVAIGASCAYMMPTGYQTHMIVYGPGGYKFLDFFKMGVIMDLIIWTVGICLIPKIWPMIW